MDWTPTSLPNPYTVSVKPGATPTGPTEITVPEQSYPFSTSVPTRAASFPFSVSTGTTIYPAMVTEDEEWWIDEEGLGVLIYGI